MYLRPSKVGTKKNAKFILFTFWKLENPYFFYADFLNEHIDLAPIFLSVEN